MTSDKSNKQICWDAFTLSVGNTNTRLIGWCKGTPDWPLAWKTGTSPPPGLKVLLKASRKAHTPVVLAGVVPAYKEEMASLLLELGCETLIFRKELRPALEIVPRPLDRVGDDRIAGALGALALDPRTPWVIVDVGTAMTINAVTPARRGGLPRFEGGLIVPSSVTSLLALSQHTAQLPLLARLPVAKLSHGTFIGRSTEQAMLLGAHHAQVAAAVALVKGQMRELGPHTRVVLTGGESERALFQSGFSRTFAPRKVVFVADLVHLGLYSAWRTWASYVTSVGGVGETRDHAKPGAQPSAPHFCPSHRRGRWRHYDVGAGWREHAHVPADPLPGQTAPGRGQHRRSAVRAIPG